jgi:hypothetical protein
MPPPFTANGANEDGETPGSGEETPWEERAPRFAHECVQPPHSEDEPAQLPEVQQRSSEEDEGSSSIDLNDPSIEDFPCERHLILEKVRTSATRLSEDETVWQVLSQCPISGSNDQPERSEVSERSESSSSSPGRVAGEARTPSLDSIPEEYAYAGESFSALPGAMHTKHDQSESEGLGHGKHEALATHNEEPEPTPKAYEPKSAAPQPRAELTQHTVPRRTSARVDIPSTTCNIQAPGRLHPDSRDITAWQTMDGAHGEGESVQSILINADIGNQGATDTSRDGELSFLGAWSSTVEAHLGLASSLKARTAYLSSPPTTDSATNSGREGSGLSPVTSRKAEFPLPDRPLTPSSMRSGNFVTRSRELLKTFLRLIFVEWIGGMIKRLCGRCHRGYAPPPREPLQ